MNTRVFKVVLFLTFCLGGFVGYSYIGWPYAPGSDNRIVRGIAVVGLFALASMLSILAGGASRQHWWPWLINGVVLYGLAISAVYGELFVSFSMTLRLVAFALILNATYLVWTRTQAGIAHWIGGAFVFLGGSFGAQLAFDVISSRGVWLNEANRFAASVGSPIGLAATEIVLMGGLLYFWLRSGRIMYLFFSIVCLIAIMLTATRSIAFWSVLVFGVALWLRASLPVRVLLLFILPVGVALVFFAVGTEVALVSRTLGASALDGVDGSTGFRLFILEVYFSQVTVFEMLFGIGLGRFPDWFFGHTGIEGVAPHFEWLWLISEFGILIFIGYLGVYLILIIRALSMVKRRGLSFRFLAFFILPSHMFFLVLANPFYFIQFVIPYAVLWAIFLAEIRRESLLYERGLPDGDRSLENTRGRGARNSATYENE